MTSPLSGIPDLQRRRMAVLVGAFALLFAGVGAAGLAGPDTLWLHVLVGAAFLVALVLLLIAWGAASSIRRDRESARLDAALAEIVAANGANVCSCGHDHDASELHIVDAEPADACGHDGSGEVCAHDCSSCVLTALRGEQLRSRAGRTARRRAGPATTPR